MRKLRRNNTYQDTYTAYSYKSRKQTEDKDMNGNIGTKGTMKDDTRNDNKRSPLASYTQKKDERRLQNKQSQHNDIKSPSHYHMNDGNGSNGNYHSHYDNMLCQNCINRELINKKNRRSMLESQENQSYLFSYKDDLIDRLRTENTRKINANIQSRALRSREVSDCIKDYQSNAKDSLIVQHEQAPNQFTASNNNYNCYLKARLRTNQNEALAKEKIDHYADRDRLKDAYYTQYVDNDNARQFFLKTTNDRDKIYDQYNEDLKNQIKFNQINREMRLRQENEIDQENARFTQMKNNAEMMDHEESRQRQFNAMREYNQQAIRDRANKKNRESQEDEEFNRKFRENIERELYEENMKLDARRRKTNQEMKEYLDRVIEEKKQQYEQERYCNRTENKLLICHEEDPLYPCSVCHKQYPSKLLSRDPFSSSK